MDKLVLRGDAHYYIWCNFWSSVSIFNNYLNRIKITPVCLKMLMIHSSSSFVIKITISINQKAANEDQKNVNEKSQNCFIDAGVCYVLYHDMCECLNVFQLVWYEFWFLFILVSLALCFRHLSSNCKRFVRQIIESAFFRLHFRLHRISPEKFLNNFFILILLVTNFVFREDEHFCKKRSTSVIAWGLVIEYS